jgi:nucleoside-diphosphate-sugar epimerase
MTDVELLARAIEWPSEAPAARNRTFNVTNGDVFTWRDMWPVIAEEVGLPAGLPSSFSVRAEIADRAGDWARLVQLHKLDLPADPLAYLGESAALSDFALNGDRNVVTSTIAIRRPAFTIVSTAPKVW